MKKLSGSKKKKKNIQIMIMIISDNWRLLSFHECVKAHLVLNDCLASKTFEKPFIAVEAY